ncbi:MAG: dipeptide/oligopeptide/nickel ABC transporter permease/ATP-binding protein [Synergistaceae bacterium]|jgi:peptide/nickel transport system permease protein|nr:dipeptide/oligopeptide/nickel ABC transporter permease/ATP-binding protein [Synergistaceae bacterium]
MSGPKRLKTKKLKSLLSPLCLFVLAALAILGPEALGLQDGPQAPPYAKPDWLDRSAAPAAALRADAARTSQTLDWSYSAPLRVSLTGRLDSGSVLWNTPESAFVLAGAGAAGEKRELDLDARDIAFKRSLGVSPFVSLPSVLFPAKGEYRLSLTGSGDVTLKIEGGRWGWLGTDQRGRDVAALFVRGIRVSLLVGIAATLIATLLGLSFGLLSGYAGGLTDALIMRAVDVLLSIPTLPILMVAASLWGKSLWNLVLLLSVFSWMGTARTVRSMTLSLRDAPWVEGLRALGARRFYILFRHLVPEALPLLLANVALGVPGAILAEAGLAFLGLSDPRVPSWGRMLHEAHTFGAFTNGAWWTILPPGLGISLICLTFMDIGRKLEERSDPRLAGVADPCTPLLGASPQPPITLNPDQREGTLSRFRQTHNGSRASGPGGVRGGALKSLPALCLSGLSVFYRGREVPAVRECSFSVSKGEVVGLVGESGSGKTSALMAIPRLLPAGTLVTGGILYVAKENVEKETVTDLAQLGEEAVNGWRWRRIALVPQGAMNSFTPHLTIERHITEVLEFHLRVTRREAKSRAAELLRTVGLDGSFAARYPHELSGGQKQRAALAAALSCNPDFLLADEPTTALDVITQKEVLDMTVRLVRERGMGLLLVTHDLPLAAGVCDTLVVMKDGAVTDGGPVREVIEHSEHPYTRRLVRAIRDMENLSADSETEGGGI